MRMILPDYATRFEGLSHTVCFLDLKGVGDEPRQATGFFWRRDHEIFLITNWHVVTSINTTTGVPLAKGWCPERLLVEFFTQPTSVKWDGAIMGPDTKILEAPTMEIPLYENFHQPFWLQHSMTFDWGIDIVALRVDKALNGRKVKCINDYRFPRLYQFIGSDVFVVGHPIVRKDSTYPVMFPVWKRGSIASELLISWNMRPAFLIDSRTSAGMSGSPVFSRVFGPAAHGDGTIKTENILTSEFMGVYSGRLFDDDNNASIGLVWHRNLIDQILDAPAAGSRDWRPASSTNTTFTVSMPV